MNANLDGKKTAIWETDGFEQSEREEPGVALVEAKAEPHVISPNNEVGKAWDKDQFGDSIKMDVAPNAMECVRAFPETGKLVAAICHGPQVLIKVDAVPRQKLTSCPSLKTDLINAGASQNNQS